MPCGGLDPAVCCSTLVCDARIDKHPKNANAPRDLMFLLVRRTTRWREPQGSPVDHARTLVTAAQVASPLAKDKLHGLRNIIVHRTDQIGYAAYAILIGGGRGDRCLIAAIPNPCAISMNGRAVRKNSGDVTQHDPVPTIDIREYAVGRATIDIRRCVVRIGIEIAVEPDVIPGASALIKQNHGDRYVVLACVTRKRL